MAEPATTAISLAAHLRSSSVDRNFTVAVATQVGDELAALHGTGRAYGKLTTADVLIHREHGRVRITLLGVPKAAGGVSGVGIAEDVYAFGALLREICTSLRQSGEQVPDWDAAIAACLDPDVKKRPSIAATMQAMGLPLSEATLAVVPQPAAGQELARWGPFQLMQRIGRGAFGEVYRAWDPVLERDVALKLLLPRDLNAEQQYAEVVSEARALARVRHAGVVAAYGVDRHDGRVGFWSDFVRGRTLQRIVETTGPLPANEVAAIGIAVCDALSAVHGEGLLHRDIKASNCMRDENGRVLLMDFGLSQDLRQAVGFAGTPNYMAPELLAGQGATVQSDLYALGVLLWFLCTGTYPSAQAAGTSAIPAPLEKVIQKAIERDPSQRWVSAAKMGEELTAAQANLKGLSDGARPQRFARRWWWAGLGAAVLIAGGLILFPMLRNQARAKAAGATPATYQDYLTAEATLDRYDKPGNTEKAIDLFQSILQRSPNFALAEAGLARADWRMYRNTSKQQWADQANQAAASAEKMNAGLAPVELTLGNLNIAQGHAGLGMQELQEALQLDPMNAEAHAGLAEAYRVQGRMDDAKKEFQVAIDLAPEEWRWLYLRGALELDAGNYKDAESDFKTALDKTPDNALVLRNLGIAFRKENRLSEAQKAYEQSLQLNPQEDTMISLGNVLMLEEKIPEAIDMFHRAVQVDPSDWFAWGELALAQYWKNGDSADTRNAFATAIEKGQAQLKTTPNDPFLISSLASWYGHIHQQAAALPLIRKSLVLAPHDPDVLENAAESYELIGNRTEALRLIGQALQYGLPVDYARRIPELKALRADPRSPQPIRN